MKAILVLFTVGAIFLLASIMLFLHLLDMKKRHEKWYCYFCKHGKKCCWGGLMGDLVGCEIEINCKNYEPEER